MLRAVQQRSIHRRKIECMGRRALKTIDLSEPHLWHSDARSIQRSITCHVGGTNSGKTYNALNALADAKTGLYCGPLRLLAWEVQGTLAAKGVKCSLLTGQEKDQATGETHISSTIEMADLSKDFDVAVIDEAQLLGDESRGWAWTNAVLGLRAKEIHLCGSQSMLPIIEKLCLLTGDTMTVKRYSRLTPLTVSAKSIRTYKRVEAGDCIVGFGRRALYDIKREIETLNPGLRCCVIYGGLPPEARKNQALLFSTPKSGYDVLVASDAIGMGLNLSIRRIVFSTLEKFDGRVLRRLSPAEIKQIAGRAGRYGTLYQDGEVTCLHATDLKHVRLGMQTPDEAIVQAGLFPSLEQLQLLSILMDFKVTDEALNEFWNHTLYREWGEFGVPHDGSIIHNHLNAGVIMRNFSSIGNFTKELKSYLEDLEERKKSGSRKAYNRHGNLRGSSEMQVPSDSERFLRVGNGNHFEGRSATSSKFVDESPAQYTRQNSQSARQNNAIKNALLKLQRNNDKTADPSTVSAVPAQTHQADTDSELSEEYVRNYKMQQSHLTILNNEIDLNSRKSNSERSPVNKGRNFSDDLDMLVNFSGNTFSKRDLNPYQDIKEEYHIPLSELLAKFHRNSDMGDCGTYFLCDLEEKINIAKAIDFIRLPFKTRYIFCMAPVASDNKMLMGKFVSMARDFSRNAKVEILISSFGMNVPATPTEMLDIESLHRYFEAYLWLSHRFPSEFRDTVRAIKESKHCAALVEGALKSFAAAPVAITAKKIRKKISKMVRKDEDSITVQMDTGMSIQSSSEG